ncbi:MAG: DUF2855 family protein [Myxococcota bacterium]
MSEVAGLDFTVNRSAWNETHWVESGISTDLAPGQVLFRVDRFALTANNITYAAAGDALGYWRFFPADAGWGRIPAMGFGDVIASTHGDIPVGTRCFGFFPMSRHLRIEPSTATATSIVDAAAHRAGLAPVYNQYQPIGGDPLYSADHEDELMLLRGLFMTSFLAEDFLGEADLHGARSVVISSASSKTSIALAFVVSQRARAKAVGLTSARNADFVKGLGFYDEVVTYDQIGSLPAEIPSVFVDMAGNEKVSRTIHEHFRGHLTYSQRIGATHWDAGGDAGELPGPKREFFFAPAQIKKRLAEWGPQGFQERLGASWTAFRDASRHWLTVQRSYGPAALEQVYAETLAGSASPQLGHVISVWEEEDSAAAWRSTGTPRSSSTPGAGSGC